MTVGIVATRPSSGDALGLCSMAIAPSLQQLLSVSLGDCIRISTRRERTVVGRVQHLLQDDVGGTIQFDRFTRQALKAFPNEEVSVERVDLVPTPLVILAPAILVPEGHVAQLLQDVRKVLVEQRVPLRSGMLVYVKLPDGQAGITYDVHMVQAVEGIVGEETQVYFAQGSEHEHGEGAHTHAPALMVERVLDTTYEDVGGLAEQIRAVRECVELPLLFPQVYRQLGIAPPRGILFHGAPGTGKTLLARSVANEIDARFSNINGPEIVGSYSGQTEENLRKLFGEASLNPPAIIFIDEIDAIAPIRGTTGTLSDVRVVTQLLSLMDGLKQSEGVVVVGTTNRLEAIDPALRRAGRFDREVFFPTPTTEAREQILRVHTRAMPLTAGALARLPEIAQRAHGFVGADLMELSREAALSALRRAAGKFLDSPSLASYPMPGDLVVTEPDLEGALQRVHPSSMRESLVVDPDVGWEDVGGLRTVKQRLRDLVERPLRHPDLFASVGLATNLGVLLYGPPGTGKTLLAKAVAGESGVNFIAVQGPELFSQWLGESEEGVRRVFRTAQRAAPCIIFFDQLDAIVPRRVEQGSVSVQTPQRVLNQMLTELDGMQSRGQVVVIGATNNFEAIDAAALRPGRFGVHLYVGLPETPDRAEILRIHLRGAAIEPAASAAGLIDRVAEMTNGFTGADVAFLCQTAKLHALARADFARAVPLALPDFEAAIGELGGNPGQAHPRSLAGHGQRPSG